MKKVSIVYATKTNHSRKIAYAIGKELNVSVENVTDHPVLLETDLLFIVSGIYGGNSLPKLLEFVNSLNSQMVKSVALVTSCASKECNQDNLKKILNEKGIKVVDEFVCRGGFLFFYMFHPNSQEIQEAVAFAVDLLER